MRYHPRVIAALGASLLPLLPAAAQSPRPPAPAGSGRSVQMEAMSAELEAARAEIQAQRRALEAQEARLRALESRIESAASAPAASPPSGTAVASTAGPPGGGQVPVERVGEAPVELEMPTVAVLGEQGSVVTRAGQITVEASLEYARADRNRFLFRGQGIAEVILLGQFEISESRQDILTATAGLRYGISDRLELGVRVPYVYRSDSTILTGVRGSGSEGRRFPSSPQGSGIGDFEVSTRYQLISARRGLPFVIANLQVVMPTGTSAFEVPRDPDVGAAEEIATGSGFWSVSPSLTAILPSDPAVLFGTLGYTYSFAESVNTRIANLMVERVDPGQALAASVGIGVSLNQRTSFNLGYAHSWVFGTETRSRLIEANGQAGGPLTTAESRDLQLGRLLFGVTYRLNNRANLNWTIEVGATEDATDLRTVLRIPIVL